MNLGTYNIQDVCGFGLLQKIRAVRLGNYDVMLLMKTKISDTVYCKNHLGYAFVCLRATPTAAGGVQGGIGLVMRERTEVWDMSPRSSTD